jgi:heme-degrading monooxygenase HmoA
MEFAGQRPVESSFIKGDVPVPAPTNSLSRRTLVAAGLTGGFAVLTQIPAFSQDRKQAMESTIADGKPTTLVNIFAVEPANQQKLIDVLAEGTDSFFSKMPGFVSSSVLKGRDGRQVVNYSQWRGVGDIAAFRQDPRFAPYVQRLVALAKAETIECDLTYVNRA